VIEANAIGVAPAGPDAESLLDTETAAAFLSLSRRTLEAWRYVGKGPRWIRFSRGAVRYRRGDLIEFIRVHQTAGRRE
jgi:hypothetical protein